ncbi:LysE family translocator [Jannaschia aquimarina]|uniref:EamB_2 protein n=1 Tax=Jannaschia aquimarina TaxID=935700 RepID=A0A0D1EBK2_9RHOB|nr:LysE family translocator [Jannaschia aquimarina]KIT14266.1 Cysteine/O-acetylserine efflux protein [Jannaschia aquimarina]SNS49566.1 Threonine/homoserine/homoserine lactone efflux protein [Jannaschia aquimarina]
MTPDLALALVGFAFVTSITPGPNNLMLMASGANFGLRRTVPHMLGVGLGFGFMIVCVGLGLAGLFEIFPAAKLILAALSVLYLLWLAWRIANAAPPEPGAEAGRPLTFLQAAAFQWVNPKAWTMALTALSLYSTGALWSVAAVAVIFTAVNLPSVGSWTLLGQGMARWLTSPARLRAFNWTMAGLLVASLWPSVAPLI